MMISLSERIMYSVDDSFNRTLAVLHAFYKKMGFYPAVKTSPYLHFLDFFPSDPRKYRILYDAKLFDMPHVVAHTVSLVQASMLTIHIRGDWEMMRAAVKARDARKDMYVRLIGVTKLATELSNTDEITNMAFIARDAGLDGVMCSAYTTRAVKEKCGEDFTVINPGIRMPGYEFERRPLTATPQFALEEGADYIVVGRAISMAKDIKKAIDDLFDDATVS